MLRSLNRIALACLFGLTLAATSRAEVGEWKMENGELELKRPAAPVMLIFGDPTWTNYEFTCDAQRLSGPEGFLVGVRITDEQNLIWANLGGWNNTANLWECLVDNNRINVEHKDRAEFKALEANQWYKLKVRCEDQNLQCFIDDTLVMSAQIPQYAKGKVGIGAWETLVKYRNIKVTTLDGKVLTDKLPALP